MCWLFTGYCIVCTSTSHAVFSGNRLWAGFKGFLFLFTSLHWWLRSYPLNLSRVSLWGERVQPLCYKWYSVHRVTISYCLIQQMMVDEKISQACTASGRALSNLRRLCIQNDFIRVSGVNQCFVTVSLLMWIQQIALWFELVLRR